MPRSDCRPITSTRHPPKCRSRREPPIRPVEPGRLMRHDGARAWVEGALTSGSGSGATRRPLTNWPEGVRFPKTRFGGRTPRASPCGQAGGPVHDCPAIRLEEAHVGLSTAEEPPAAADELVEDALCCGRSVERGHQRFQKTAAVADATLPSAISAVTSSTRGCPGRRCALERMRPTIDCLPCLWTPSSV